MNDAQMPGLKPPTRTPTESPEVERAGGAGA
jgi:hypothetical protein